MDKTVKKFHERNPFTVEGMKERFKTQVGKRFNYYDDSGPESGILNTATRENKTYLIVEDCGSYVKLFKAYIALLMSLSDPGRVLALFCCKELKIHSEIVLLVKEKVMFECGFKSQTTFNKAVNELVDRGVLARRSSIDYWVNVNVMFNGNRQKIEQ